MLSPGLRLLLRVASKCLAIPLFAYSVCLVLEASSSAHSYGLVKTLLEHKLLLCTASLPLFLVLRHLYVSLMQERELRSLGAVRVPVVTGRWPGNLDLLLDRLKESDAYPFDSLTQITRKYGNIFNTKILGEDRIVICDPAHMKIILATEQQNWHKGAEFRGRFESVLGNGVLNSDGEMWKFHRSMTRPLFSRTRISDFDTFERHAQHALSSIHAVNGGPLDFQALMYRFTFDVIIDFVGLRTYMKAGDDPEELYKVERAFTRLQHHLAPRSRAAPISSLFEIRKDRTSDDMKILRKHIFPAIEAALAQKVKEMPGSEPKDKVAETLLDELVNSTDDAQLIFDEIITMLTAGRETTTSGLTFAMYLLAAHPTVFKKLKDEITTSLGPSRLPSYSDLRDLRNLRLFPPLPGNARSSLKVTTLSPLTPGGQPYYIPAGTKVPTAVMHMHRRKDLWGSDALQFDPDRFLDERLKKFYLKDPFIHLPFNAGPRICLGQQFALAEISYFLTRLFQTFDKVEMDLDSQPPNSLPPPSWAKCDPDVTRKTVEKIRPKSDLVLSIQGGLWLKFTGNV